MNWGWVDTRDFSGSGKIGTAQIAIYGIIFIVNILHIEVSGISEILKILYMIGWVRENGACEAAAG